MNTKKLAGELTVATGASKGICAAISRLIRRRSVVDIVERFQTQHALQEERETKNFHSSNNGAALPACPMQTGWPRFRVGRNSCRLMVG